MTTTYKAVNYETADALRDAINSELAALAYPYPVKHNTFGEGYLTSVKAPWNGPALFATIDFASGTKVISLEVVFSANLITMPEILTDILIEAQNVFKTDFEAREQERKEAYQQAQIQARERAKKAEEEKKAEAKYKQHKEKTIREFEKLADRDNELSEVDDFYYSLGWLANHIGSVSAQLPDYLGPSFERHFGADAPKTLIDGKAKSIGGFAKKWSWEFKCSLKKLKDTTVPAYIQSLTSDVAKGIHNTSFVWNIVDNYGFRFGKTQDLEKIKQTIPAKFISSFEAGLLA